MNRSAQSAGSGEVVFERREEDPTYRLGSKRRPGSLRQDDYSAAPGLRCEAVAANAYCPDQINWGAANRFFSYVTITVPEMPGSTKYEIARFGASEDASTDVDSTVLTLERASATTCTLTVTATDGSGSYTRTATLTVGTNYDIMFGVITTTLYLYWSTWGGAASAATGAHGRTFSSQLWYYAIGRGWVSGDTGFDHPVLSNARVALGVSGSIADALSTRAADSNLTGSRHWDMIDPYRVMASDGDSAGYLHLHPAAPAIVDSAAQFGGRSGAVYIEPSLSTERFFATAAEAVADKEFTIYAKGTRGNRGATGRKEVIFDYGDLAQLYIHTDNTVIFTYNGASPTTVGTIAPGAAFTIYAGRTGSSIFLNLDGTAATPETAPTPPYLDLSAAPGIYVGAEEDTATDSRYVGSLTKLALWPEYTLTDLGARSAAFYLDLTEAIEDQSPNAAAVAAITHTEDSGDPHFTAGPIQDAAHRAVVGGLVLGDSGPVDAGWDSALARRIEGDATGLRVGRRVFCASQDTAHIFDDEALVGRPFGVPQPPPGVTATTIGSGLLDGAYGYGYRYISRDGTYGPVRRLDPIAATQGARVVLGSSAGAGDSELGETYGDIPAATASNFSHSVASAPGAGTFVEEVYARLLDHEPEEVEEDVMNRGAISTSGNGIQYLESGAPTPLDLGQDWTIQCDFRYQARTGLSVDGIVSTDIVGVCQPDSSKNSDFFATIIHDLGGDAAQSKYTSRWPNNDGVGDAHYGDTEPRLVVGIARRATRIDIAQSAGRNFPSENYFLLTFTDDATWTDGNDYSVIFKRVDGALEVWVQDRTASGAYTKLVGRTMAGSGVATSGGSTQAADGYASARFTGTETRAAYTATTFFKNGTFQWQPKSTAHRIYFGRAAYNRCVIPFISNDSVNVTVGVPEHADHRYPDGALPELTTDIENLSVKPMTVGEVYQFRAWNRGVPDPDVAGYAKERFAARGDGELAGDCIHDVACVVEDTNGSVTKFQDAAGGGFFHAKSGTGLTANMAPFAQDAAALAPDKQYVWVMETGPASGVSAAALYWTSLGNGTWVLEVTGEDEYRLMARAADSAQVNARPNMATRETLGINETVRSDDEYNWFSFSVKVLTSGTSKIQILNLAVNGTPLFTGNLGGSAVTVDSTPTQYIGGWTGTTGDKHVAVGEWRYWDDGEGPDPETGDDFNYLGGRVSENEYQALANKLLVYAKFQGDDVSGSALTNYGSDGNTLTLVATATVVDGRNAANTIPFPASPAEYIVGVELLRSFGISIQDPEDESEVQQALDEARFAPLYRLAIIPTGSTHYVDTAADSGLGFEVDTRTGFTPDVVKGIFTWQGHVGLVGDRTTLHFSEPGPFGWESYPRWLDYEVPGAGGAVTAGAGAGNLAYAFGKAWAVVLGGSPSNPETQGVGGGVGATDQRSVAALGDIVFAYNGELWAIRGTEAQEIGDPVRDLLPAAGSCRLVVSALLSSLLVIDLDTGDVLRYYLPTKRWTIESRDLLAAGDLADGSATAFISQQGTWSKANASYIADDVEASTSTSGTGTLATDTVTLGANITIPTLARVQVEDASGNSAAAVPSESGSTGTLTFPAGSMSALTDGAVTVRPGMPSVGHLIDTGWIDQGYNGHFEDVVYSIDSGSGWSLGAGGGSTPGSKTSRSGVSYAGVTGTGERLGIGRGHRFIRAVARNFAAEAGSVGYLAIGARPGGGR